MADTELITIDDANGVRTITMDDGRVNAFSVPMLEALHEALDGAEAADSIVVLRGREGTFSAGFDLKTIGERTNEMLGLGARLTERLFSFPRPVIAVCTGHGIAMGGFTLLASDLRIGTAGDFRIGLNEVVIGLTIPRFGIAVAGHRLSRAWHDRATLTGELFGPEDARTAGFLDRVVDAVRARCRHRGGDRRDAGGQARRPPGHQAARPRCRPGGDPRRARARRRRQLVAAPTHAQPAAANLPGSPQPLPAPLSRS